MKLMSASRVGWRLVTFGRLGLIVTLLSAGIALGACQAAGDGVPPAGGDGAPAGTGTESGGGAGAGTTTEAGAGTAAETETLASGSGTTSTKAMVKPDTDGTTDGAMLIPIVAQTTTLAALPAPEAVTVDLQGLAGKLTVTQIKAAPFFPEGPAAGNGSPGALRLTFDDQPLTDAYVVPRERQLVIYPAGGFHALYAGQQHAGVGRSRGSLGGASNAQPVTISAEIPVLPELGASQALAVQEKYVAFAGGRGIRFVAHYDQAINPFTNQSIFYTFQGLTQDGKYYVSFFYPVRTDVLPDQFSDVSTAQEDEILNNYAVYRARMHTELNRLSEDDFVPNLAKLDAMVGSLKIGP